MEDSLWSNTFHLALKSPSHTLNASQRKPRAPLVSLAPSISRVIPQNSNADIQEYVQESWTIPSSTVFLLRLGSTFSARIARGRDMPRRRGGAGTAAGNIAKAARSFSKVPALRLVRLHVHSYSRFHADVCSYVCACVQSHAK